MHKVEVSNNGKIATLTFNDLKPSRFHAIWLRDNAHDDKTRAPGNGQRLITLSDIPANTSIASAKVTDNTLQIVFQPENKTIEYDINWLTKHSYDDPANKPPGWTAENIETWDAQLNAAIPTADYKQINSNTSALCEWLSYIHKYGFAKLTNGPVEPGQPRFYRTRPAGSHR